MAQRGRKSAASLALVATNEEGVPLARIGTRVPPPDTLQGRAREIWVEVTASMQSDWFPRHTHEVLAAYCRHAASMELLDTEVAKFERGQANASRGLNLDRYGKLLALREKESRALQAHARSLRITKQATRRGDDPGPTAPEARPWEG